jgi:excisionase family DNA binding protein
MTKPEHRNDDPLYDNDPAAAHLGVEGHTLEVWRSTGRYLIPYIKVGRRVKYRRSALDKWLESRTVNAEAA